MRVLSGFAEGDKKRDRRLKIKTIRTHIARAEEKLELRIAALVTKTLVPEPLRNQDDFIDAWSQAIHQAAAGPSFAKKFLSTTP